MASDPFSSRDLGHRLRQARETAGVSTRSAARKLALAGIPVSHATVANYERGDTFPTTETIKALARLYGRPHEWFLSSGPSLTGGRYRCLKSVRVRDKQSFEGVAAGLFQIYVELENLLGREKTPLEFDLKDGDSGQEAAERLRAKLKLRDHPLPSVTRLLEQLGLLVVQVDTEARIDGLAAEFGDRRVVALNAGLPSDRTRLNGGHEAFHQLAGDTAHDGPDSDAMERRAFEFASHLLMPEGKLKEIIDTGSMVRMVQAKERYGLSLAAMVFRAKEGGHINEKTYTRLWREFSRLGWRKDEPGYVQPDRPTRLEELIEMAVTGGQMSYGDVARLGGLDEGFLRRRVRQAMDGVALTSDGDVF